MTKEQLLKIESAVADCLRNYDPVHMPFATISKFIEHLKAKKEWTAEEAKEVQVRVLRVILSRQSQLGPSRV